MAEKIKHDAVIHNMIGRMGSGLPYLEQELKSGSRTALSSSKRRALEAALANERQKIESLRLRAQKGRSTASLPYHEKRLELLERMAPFKSVYSAVGLAAALARENGISSEKLSPSINAMKSLNKEGPTKKAIYLGALTALGVALQPELNYIEKAHDALHSSPRALSISDLSRELGAPKKHGEIIGAALALLARLGLAQKLPREGDSPRWVHACYKEHSVTIPVWNGAWKIFHLLDEGPKKMSELKHVKGARQQLYQLVAEKIATGSTGGRFELTKTGRELLQKQKQTSFLLPELREMLTESTVAKAAESVEERILARMRRWAHIKQALETERTAQTTYSDTVKIAKKLGEKRAYVVSVVQGRLPWRGIPQSKLVGHYLPKLRETAPSLAAMVEEEIKKEKEKEGK
ncbi:MAG TPA: hypothetical protein VGQ00_00235 [Candidatus Norongarragalinales archaeon]|jgi:hypothetical protein|nr:hypothetical protein [Candidatus Norongarragalinales archaeon]